MKELQFMRLLLVNGFLFILLAATLGPSPDVRADGMTSPITVTIKMAQETYMLSDTIAGNVVLTNAGFKIPAAFDVKVFLNGKSQQSFSVAFNTVFSGVNRFSLKDFSIRIPDQAGQWQIVIKQQGLGDDYAATADFAVQNGE
jgi:hypothetical protein